MATTLTGIALGFVDELLGGEIVGVYGPLSLIFTFGLFIPGLTVMIRRLHDIGRSGWWALLSAGSYVLVFIGLIGSDPAALFASFEVFENIGVGPILALVAAWVISAIVLLVFMVTRGDEGDNEYGADPYGPGKLEEIFA